MSAKDPLSPEHILGLGLGFWASKALLSAVEMGVFTELASGPQPLDELAGRLGLHARSARDYLDTLVALGLLQRSNGEYSNAADTDFFLDRNKPSYIGGILEMSNSRLYGFWGGLTEALRTGRPQSESKDASGASPFDVLYAEPARLREFLTAMSAVSHGSNMAIAEKFSCASYKVYADVGTAQGDLAVQIAMANPHLECIGFDLAQVAPIFEDHVAVNGLRGRVRFQAGDFFADDLPAVDVITMGHILHDWGLDRKKTLIAKAYKALNPGGSLVVYDAIIDDDRSRNAFGLLMSLNMLVETAEGFDYTGADCTGWMEEAGFHDVRVEHLTGPDSMVVGIK